MPELPKPLTTEPGSIDFGRKIPGKSRFREEDENMQSTDIERLQKQEAQERETGDQKAG